MKNYISKIVVVVAVCLLFSYQNIAQTNVKIKYSSSQLTKEEKESVKLSESSFKLGNPSGYAKALKGYKLLHEYAQAENPEIAYKYGICLLFSANKKDAAAVLSKAYTRKKDVTQDVAYFLAYAYQMSDEFDLAIKFYEEFKKSQSGIQEKKRVKVPETANKRIDECNNAKKMMSNPIRVWIDNMGGNNINTSYSEYGPVLPIDESFIIFTSRREGKEAPEDNQPYENIYKSDKDPNTKEFGKPINMKTLNLSDGHNAVVGLSPDGTVLYIYRGYDGGTILESKQKGTVWEKPKEVKGINVKKYQTSSASLSHDGKYLYFVSNRPKDGYGTKTLGGLDIFVCEKQKNGKWGKAKNLGSPINTKYDEEGIFLHPDGITMYFSSKREGSMGGYDVYKSEKDKNGNWKTPENIGYPINSTGDDVFFVVATNPRYAFFSSSRVDSKGLQDIYKITFLGPEKLMAVGTEDFLIASSNTTIEQKVKQEEVEVKKVRLTIMKGTVKDALSQEAIEAKIELTDSETNEVVNTINSNSASGKYMVSFPSGSSYKFTVSAPSYSTYSEDIEIPETAAYQEVTKDFVLTKAGVGSKIVLKNIEFDLAKATLRSTSFPELDRLVKLLESYPSMIIEIGGHTDNTGSKAINEKLSAERAKAVVDYLVEKGIAQNRLTYAGYADTQPIADNKTETGRQQNRRVEFKVVSMK